MIPYVYVFDALTNANGDIFSRLFHDSCMVIWLILYAKERDNEVWDGIGAEGDRLVGVFLPLFNFSNGTREVVYDDKKKKEVALSYCHKFVNIGLTCTPSPPTPNLLHESYVYSTQLLIYRINVLHCIIHLCFDGVFMPLK